MKTRFILLLFLLSIWPVAAHVGSPDIFYNGPIGPYAAQVTIRVPGVVPGLAVITVRVLTPGTATVSFRPLFARAAVSNAPPPDVGRPVEGETNVFAGELWLMASGAYSIDISINGKAGAGSVQIPVDAVATRQLPLPPGLGGVLAFLGVLLILGGAAIVAAAAADAALPPGVLAGSAEKRRRRLAAVVTTSVFVLALAGGKKWWDAEEKDFRLRLRAGGWPDLQGAVSLDSGRRILTLTMGQKDLGKDPLRLAPDHGKLLHLFLVRLPAHDAFAHLHPVRKGNQTFEVALPDLPQGDYEMFCDLTMQNSGVSSTATNLVHLPPPSGATGAISLQPDPDDSWAANGTGAVPSNPGRDTICALPESGQLIWKSHPTLRANQDASLNFEARDAAGQPLALQAYMGMMGHVAVLRSDDRVFAHLHPSGNFSMAAQVFFDAKLEKESGGNPKPDGMNRTKMRDMMRHDGGVSSLLSVPYQFPSAGDYLLWVQVKSGDHVLTAVFETAVE